MYKYIFGPVNSRRLGYSLGIDLLGGKICSFNCVYCEVEKTKTLTDKRKAYVSAKDVTGEIDHFFSSNPLVNIDYITLSGKGEPTLNIEIENVITHIKRNYPVPVAVLTNASLLNYKEVRQDIMGADLIVPSIDAISDDVYKEINLPKRGVRMEDIVRGVYKLRQEFLGKLFIEILFVKGINDSRLEIEKLKDVVRYIKPSGVHINTIYRPPSFSKYSAINKETLKKLEIEFSMLIEKEKRECSFSSIRVNKTNYLWDSARLKDELKALLQIRPCTIEDLSRVFCSNKEKEEELRLVLNALTEKNTLLKKEYGSSVFYALNK